MMVHVRGMQWPLQTGLVAASSQTCRGMPAGSRHAQRAAAVTTLKAASKSASKRGTAWGPRSSLATPVCAGPEKGWLVLRGAVLLPGVRLALLRRSGRISDQTQAQRSSASLVLPLTGLRLRSAARCARTALGAIEAYATLPEHCNGVLQRAVLCRRPLARRQAAALQAAAPSVKLPSRPYMQGNMVKNGAFLELPAQPWELQAAALGGLTLSQLRFFISFMLSVVLGAVLKHVPSARGTLGTLHLPCTGVKKMLQRCTLQACSQPSRLATHLWSPACANCT